MTRRIVSVLVMTGALLGLSVPLALAEDYAICLTTSGDPQGGGSESICVGIRDVSSIIHVGG